MSTAEPDRFTERWARLGVFLRQRFSPAAAFGLHLTIGVLIVIVSCYAFLEIADDVTEQDDITAVDHDVSAYLHHRATPELTRAMFMITDAGSGPFLTVMGAGLALYLARRREWQRLLAFIVVLPGGSLLNVAVKHIVRRPRPEFEEPLATLETFSFPSAHAMAATLFYGFLALLVVTAFRVRWARVLAVAVAGLFIVAISFSRVYLGLHYLSDVLGGITAGAAWLAVGWTAAETLRRRSRERAPPGADGVFAEPR